MLGFSISYPDLIKSPFFATSLEEGMGGGEQRPKDGMISGKIPTFRQASVLVWVARASSTAPWGELHK
jgi:hypothetical protein